MSATASKIVDKQTVAWQGWLVGESIIMATPDHVGTAER
jgi:hypothetical protein